MAGVLTLAAAGLALPAQGQSIDGVDLWHGFTGADNTTSLNRYVDRYNEQAAIEVSPTAYPWDELFSKWVLSAVSGATPDAVLFHTSEVPEFAERGLLEPLEPSIEASGLDLGELPEIAIDASTWEGDLYCIPFDFHPLGLYYNVDLVEAAGLDPSSPPTDAEELLAWAEALTVRDDAGRIVQYGFDVPLSGAVTRWMWYSLLHQFGGTFLDEEGRAAVDSEAGRRALQFLVDLIHKHEVATAEIGGVTGTDAFAAGTIAMRVTGPWEVNLRMDQGMNFATAPFPTIGEQPAVWANSSCLALTPQDDAARTTAAAEFGAWLHDNLAAPWAEIGLIPFSPSTLASPEWADTPQAPYYQAFIDQLPDVVYEPATPIYTTIFSFGKPTPLTSNLQAALNRSKTVEEALADMAAGIDDQLARAR